jgi:hypothetical protein
VPDHMQLIHPEHPPANSGSHDPASPPSVLGWATFGRRLVYFLSGEPNCRLRALRSANVGALLALRDEIAAGGRAAGLTDERLQKLLSGR